MNNTIILKTGYAFLTRNEYKKFRKGDTIWGADSEPEELKRWNIEDEAAAKAELAKYRCEYYEQKSSGSVSVREYGLEYCECDEDGEFISGLSFDLAEEEADV